VIKNSQAALKVMAENCANKILGLADGISYFETPFKHLVVDNFFDTDFALSSMSAFPPTEDSSWEHANDADIEIKYRTTWKTEFDIPDGLVDAIRILNSANILKALGDKFSIPKLIPDPYFTGGGLNITKPGGLLDVHVDGNYHDATGLNRRMNAILYLNPKWQVGWGGEFGLYDEKGDKCLKQIEPLFNRLVVFDSHDKSFHGLPNPLNFPDGEDRKSIILYYYTKESRPLNQISEDKPHSALWRKRGLLDKRGNKTRAFS
jgi:Rps23 Pro-64 3,4-dihydroxylase Tpa1-like proline 4-hydroxylase